MIAKTEASIFIESVSIRFLVQENSIRRNIERMILNHQFPTWQFGQTLVIWRIAVMVNKMKRKRRINFACLTV